MVVFLNKENIDIKYLPPSAFHQLPKNVREYLENKNCQIPQAYSYDAENPHKIYGTDKPHNVVRGKLDKNRKNDWAVLCSIKNHSSILIFWDGTTAKVTELNKEKNSAYDFEYFGGIVDESQLSEQELRKFNLFKEKTGEKPKFIRKIGIADKKLIRKCYLADDKIKKPPIRHQGIIDEGWDSRVFMVEYFNQRKLFEFFCGD